MSILIRGMEMPTAQQGYTTVKIYYDGTCVRHWQGTVISEAEAVKVPNHGRLIDADELRKCIPNEEIASRMAITNAPTIIEAEK